MKKSRFILLSLCILTSFTACGNSEKKTIDTEVEVISEVREEDSDNNMQKTAPAIVGGVDVIKKEEYVSLGGVLDGADPELVAQLEESLDLEAIEQMDRAQQEKIVDNLEEISEQHSQVVSDVQEALEDKNISVDLNEKTGKITMDEKILFAKSEYELSQDGKDYLDQFFTTYVNAILDSSAEESISAIKIIGHTDTAGSYEFNQELSEKRAEAVKDYCLGISSLTEGQVNRLTGMLKTEGKSYDEPVYVNGQIDMDASRRVEFKIIMNIE